MTAAHRKFETQLENFRNEASVVARYMYAEMAIQHAASKSEALLNRLNQKTSGSDSIIYPASIPGAELGAVSITRARQRTQFSH